MKKSVKKSIVFLFVVTFTAFSALSVMHAVFPVKYEKEVKAFSEINALEPSLVFAVIRAESDFDKVAVSDKGAVGLMQLMPSTAKYVAEELFKEDCKDIYDATVNIRYGTKYLSYLREKFGDLNVALASYNAGEGNVSAWLKDERYSFDGKTLNRIPFKETENYVKKVLTFQKFYKFLYTLSA